MSESKVLATVNGKEITENSVNMFLRNLDPKTSKQYNSPQGRKKVLEELIYEELLYADAIESGYDEEEEFLNKLDEKEEELLKQYAMYKVLVNINITDDEVNKYYKDNKPNFFRDTVLRASHILVDTEDKAKQILDEINGGLEFSEAAQKYSTCPSKQQGGDLGYFPKGKMVKGFEDVAFSMDIDQISEPVKTQFGYHIIKVTDKKEPGIVPFDEIKDNLRSDLLRAKQNYAYGKKMKELQSRYKVEIKGE